MLGRDGDRRTVRSWYGGLRCAVGLAVQVIEASLDAPQFLLLGRFGPTIGDFFFRYRTALEFLGNLGICLGIGYLLGRCASGLLEYAGDARSDRGRGVQSSNHDGGVHKFLGVREASLQGGRHAHHGGQLGGGVGGAYGLHGGGYGDALANGRHQRAAKCSGCQTTGAQGEGANRGFLCCLGGDFPDNVPPVG